MQCSINQMEATTSHFQHLISCLNDKVIFNYCILALHFVHYRQQASKQGSSFLLQCICDFCLLFKANTSVAGAVPDTWLPM